jgi:hypothetical protein
MISIHAASSVEQSIEQLAGGHDQQPLLSPLVSRALAKIAAPDPSADHSWDAFDHDRYLVANYRQPSEADGWLWQTLNSCWQQIAGRLGTDIDAIDIGTGPNLYTLLAALPHVRTLTAHEFAEPNRLYLLAQRDALEEGWQEWIDSAGGGQPRHRPNDLQRQLAQKLQIRPGSIHHLRAASADAATMFFCAESITSELASFENGCLRLVRAVRPGGALLCAFMLGSTGYDTAGSRFPSVPITAQHVHDVFAPHTVIERLDRVPGSAVRPGYDGMCFMLARRN